ncbi:MAG TPA: hypothetical protein DCS43_00695 [Verrucomicrobia bacterium]|nr:hypothetical protein [Verrucomicrobiota bacterium]
MPFIKQKGVDGWIWVPDAEPDAQKKYNCPDCEGCNHCADSRCRVCLNRQCCRNNKRTYDALPE